MTEKRNRKTSKKNMFLMVAALLCAATAVFAAYKVVSILLQEKAEQEAFEDLIQIVYGNRNPNREALTEPAANREKGNGETDNQPEGNTDIVPDIMAGYAILAETNEDMFGWIKVEGTVINYPVMHTPKEPEFYLRRGFDKKYAKSGTPFLQGECFENCGNYIVYGHNMRNKTMFGTLSEYENEQFFKEHPIIEFDTLEEKGSYRVMAAFYWHPETGGPEFYRYYDLRKESTLKEYADAVKRLAIYDTGIEAETGDQLLTLATCDASDENGRFVIVAKKINE